MKTFSQWQDYIIHLLNDSCNTQIKDVERIEIENKDYNTRVNSTDNENIRQKADEVNDTDVRKSARERKNNK